MSDPEDMIRAAEHVAEILERQSVGALVIGAAALAAHGYVRFTADLDLGVNTDLPTLRTVVDILRTEGFDVELREPDGPDPLGGVVDVSGPFLACNPDADLADIRRLCQHWRLRGLEPLIDEATNR
jgi:hypothetical protein